MKKFLFLIAVCCLTTTATKAQDVLNEIVKTSLSITNDTTPVSYTHLTLPTNLFV